MPRDVILKQECRVTWYFDSAVAGNTLFQFKFDDNDWVTGLLVKSDNLEFSLKFLDINVTKTD